MYIRYYDLLSSVYTYKQVCSPSLTVALLMARRATQDKADLPCSTLSDLPALRRAVRHVLLALQDLHAAGAAHTDVRWPNIIHLPTDSFVLIDLETAVPLDCSWDVRKHGPYRACWCQDVAEVLQQGQFTALSDARLVGKLMHAKLPLLDDGGQVLASALREGKLTVSSALGHHWFVDLG